MIYISYDRNKTEDLVLPSRKDISWQTEKWPIVEQAAKMGIAHNEFWHSDSCKDEKENQLYKLEDFLLLKLGKNYHLYSKKSCEAIFELNNNLDNNIQKLD